MHPAKHRWIPLFSMLLVSTLCAETPTTAPAISGKVGEPIALFNGKNLDGWFWFAKAPTTGPSATMSDVWSVRDGLLCDKGKPNGYLRTEKSFNNYVLTVEQRHVVKGNGGILIAITGQDKVWPHCIEVQGASGSIGDFWNQGHLKMTVDPARKDAKDKSDRHVIRIGPNSENPVGEWNTVEAMVDHGNVVVKVNGAIQNVATDAEDLGGQIGLQSEGTAMEFRKIELRPIEQWWAWARRPCYKSGSRFPEDTGVMPHNYPLLLDVRDRLIVIVGGGDVAVRKVRGLIDAGATRLRVIAPAFHERMPAEVERVVAMYSRQHLADAKLVFAATDDAAINDAIVRDAQAMNILVRRADADQNAGDFATPAMIRRGPVLVTVSTGGSPALAVQLRDQIEKSIDEKWIMMAELMQTLRPRIRAIESVSPSRRREIFLELASDDAMDVLRSHGSAALIDWLKDRYPELNTLA